MRKRTESNIADILTTTAAQTRLSLQLHRRLVPEQHLRGILHATLPRIDKLLQEHLAINPIRLLLKHRTEDNRDPIMRGLDVDSFLLTVMYRADLAAFPDTLRCGLSTIPLRLLLQIGEFLKRLLKGRSHRIPLQQADPTDELVLLLLRLARHLVQVHQHGEVVALLRLHDVRAVFALEDGGGAVGG